MTEENNTEELKEISLVDSSAAKAAMAQLAHDFRVVPDVSTEEGFEENRVGLRKLTSLRTATDKLRLETTKPLRDKVDQINKQAKEIIDFVAKLEAPKKKAHDAKQRELDRIAEEEANREAVRVAAIEKRVSSIRGMVNVKMDLNDISIALAQLESIDMDDGSFDEYEEAAQAAYDYAHSTLTEYKEGAEQREAEAEKVREEAERLAAQKEEIDKQLAEIEAAKKALADQQHEMDVQKKLAEEAEAAEKSRKEEEEKAELAAAKKKADDIKKERDARVAAAIKAENMRQDRIKYQKDAKDLVSLAASLTSLRNAIATTNCDTEEATAIRLAVAASFDDIQTFIMGSDVVQAAIDEAA